MLFAISGFAQAPGKGSSRHSEIESVKIAFITKKLDLSADEAKAFWPVYNNYQKELMSIIRQRRENYKRRDGSPQNKLNDDFDFEGKILALKKDYQKEFAKVLPPQKVLTLYQAEREFREQLIKELKARRGN